MSKFVKKDDGSISAPECPERDRTLVLVGDAVMPWTLNAPPTSLREVDDYMSILTACGLPYFAVKTEFKLKGHKKGKNEWDSLVLSRSDNSVLTREEFRKVKSLRDGVLKQIRNIPFHLDEAEGEPHTVGTAGDDPNF